jgi:hypothetical protein
MQEGNWGAEADSMSSVNQKSCWDAGVTLGWKKSPRRSKTFTPWTPSPYKASPHHIILNQMLAPNLLGRHSAYQTSECQASCNIPPATLGINQHSYLGRLTPTLQKKTWRVNNELKTNTQWRGWGAVSSPEMGCGGRARSRSPRELSVNKGWKGRRADSKLGINHCLKWGR